MKPDPMRSYLTLVEEQIRWKRARSVVIQELQEHLEDQKASFISEGHSPEQAEGIAVAEMGDPAAVGMELDRIHRPRAQWGLLGLTLGTAVCCIGLRLYLTGAGDLELFRAVIALTLGCLAMLGLYVLDYTWLLRRPHTGRSASNRPGPVGIPGKLHRPGAACPQVPLPLAAGGTAGADRLSLTGEMPLTVRHNGEAVQCKSPIFCKKLMKIAKRPKTSCSFFFLCYTGPRHLTSGRI